MTDPGWAYAIGVPIALVLCIGLPLWFVFTSGVRERRQSVVIQHGTITVVDSVFGRGRTFASDRVETAVYFPPSQDPVVVAPALSAGLAVSNQDYRTMSVRARGDGGSLFRSGGLILLDDRGRMLAHVVHLAGSDAPIEKVWQQIPARRRIEASSAGAGYSRRDFKKAFPRALHFGQMWGAGRWAATMVLLLFVGVPVTTVVVIFILAFIVTALSYL
jgi:hypothetical protein